MNNQYLKVAVSAAKVSAPIFKKFFGKPKSVTSKGGDPKSLVTEIDLAIERKIRSAIFKNFPTHKIIGEEFGAHALEKNDLVWIIDPIDGTANYIQGLPLCCISIGLWGKDGPLAAVVYNPISNYLFTATKGHGAFLNGKKLKVSNKKSLELSFGGFGWGRNAKNAAKNFPILIKHLHKIRTLGSSTSELAFVASGVYDFHIQAEINIWDFAAAALLIQESGGVVSDWKGKQISLNTTHLIAGNRAIHKDLLKTLSKI